MGKKRRKWASPAQSGNPSSAPAAARSRRKELRGLLDRRFTCGVARHARSAAGGDGSEPFRADLGDPSTRERNLGIRAPALVKDCRKDRISSASPFFFFETYWQIELSP